MILFLLVLPQDTGMGQWSCRSFVVFFLLCGTFIRGLQAANTSNGEHKGSQRHLLMENDHSNSNSSEIGCK